MHNKTHIITYFNTFTPPGGDTATVSAKVNLFIEGGITAGYTNFEIKEVVIMPVYSAGVPTGDFWYTVQINYNDPSAWGA